MTAGSSIAYQQSIQIGLWVRIMLQSHRGIPFNAARVDSGGQAFSGSSMLDLEFAELSDPGKVREHNEDYVSHAAPAKPEEARTHGWLFTLADGVGGQDRGEVASRTAVDTVLSSFRGARADESPSGLLQRLFQVANLTPSASKRLSPCSAPIQTVPLSSTETALIDPLARPSRPV